LTADPPVRPDNRAVEHRRFLHVRLTADDGGREELGASLDHRPFLAEAGTWELDAFLDTGARRDELLVRLTREGRGLVETVHDVAMDLQVFRRCADVDPVAIVHVGDEGLAPLDERRKKA